MNAIAGKWISIHAEIEGDMNIFLVAVLAPVLERISGKCHRYFFIRYFDPSPHIRIRILPKSEEDDDALAAEVTGLLHYAMSENGEQRNFLLLSVTSVAYEPEVERYGGPAGISISERHFMASSDLILTLLKNQVDWAYADAIGSAIRVHLAFLQAIHLPTEIKTALVGKVHEGWLAHFLFSCPGIQRATILTAFRKAYEKQQEVLMANMGVLSVTSANDLNEDSLFWMTDWVNHVRTIDTLLTDIFKEEEQRGKKIAEIYESYMHMTNNRLGINNIDESFIAYILLNLFEDYFQ